MVNNQLFEEPKNSSEVVQTKTGLKSRLKSLMPLALKEKIKMGRLLKHSKLLEEEIINTDFQADVIIELYKLGSRLGHDLKKRFNCPLIVYYDSPVVEQYEDIWKIKAPYKSQLIDRQSMTIKAADRIIAYSNPVKEYLTNMGATGEITIFQTLDYSRLTKQEKITKDGVNIGFVGSFMPWHRVDLLVRAFDEICSNTKKDCTLHLVGKGECYEEIKTLVANCESKNKIIMHGFLDGASLMNIKSKLDIGVMPGSNWYGIPTKVYEYGAAGIASIAPDTPTIADIFTNNRDITLFKWDDYEDFKLKLHALIENDSQRQALVAGLNTKIASEHTLEIAINNYKSWINDLAC